MGPPKWKKSFLSYQDGPLAHLKSYNFYSRKVPHGYLVEPFVPKALSPYPRICEIPFSGPNINFRGKCPVLMFLRIQFSTKLKKEKVKSGNFEILKKIWKSKIWPPLWDAGFWTFFEIFFFLHQSRPTNIIWHWFNFATIFIPHPIDPGSKQ